VQRDASGSAARALRNRSRAAAFLCYHSVHPEGPDWTSVPPDHFESHLGALARSGWRTGGEAELRTLAGGGRLDRPTAFLTFDDGYADNYEIAFPLLREHGATALFYLLPPFVDDGAALAWPEVADRLASHGDVMRSLTWAQVEEMAEAGMQFGSHGLRHPHLPDLSEEQLTEELLDSRRAIADRIGSCDTFVYPFGEWTPRVAAAAQAAGYAFAFTLPRAFQAEATNWSIPRIAVDQRDDARRFGLKLRPTFRKLYLSRAKARLRGGE
jgi:peptidoglycan/xylan/chitin deacetylase (PgdA/CDA1 family)